MTELNNPKNLNPSIENKMEKKQREKQIDEWNKQPEIKKQNIEAIDKNKFRKISVSELGLLNILAIFGTISLIILAGSAGIYAYIVWQDGTLIPEFICSQNVSLSEGTIRCESQVCNPTLTCESQELYNDDFTDIKTKLKNLKGIILDLNCS